MNPRSVLLLLLALTACPHPEPCACTLDRIEFEVAGNGGVMMYYDASGAQITELAIDLDDCECADHVKIRVTHRGGLALDPPELGECVLAAPSQRASTIDMTLAVGEGCDIDWIANDTQPPVPIPIKVRP